MIINRRGLWVQVGAIVCSISLIPFTVAAGQASQQQAAAPAQDTSAPPDAKIPNDQLDALVAPIALYPDPLLAQVLAASTYPIEIVQLQQWLEKNKGLKDKALQDAVAKQDWDPSVQGLAALPDVAKRLADDVKWTTDLGNAFLAQQSDVMDAVQRMRAKAKDTGNLKSSDQQKVETKVIENKSVIVVEQANPQVVYVPSYNPTVVYGPPVYPYPPISYPPPGYYAAGMAISFGVGMAMGAAWGGGWGYGCGWGGNNDITINRNNTFVNNSNRQNVNAGNRTGNNNWQHNPQHRGGTPYGNRDTANRYGGTARGDSMGNRQANARQNQARQQNAGARGNQNQLGGGQRQGASLNDRPGGNGAGGANRSSSGALGGSSGSNRGGGGGSDRVGNRSVSSGGSSSRGGGAFGGSSGGMSGSGARSSGSRGASSMGARGGGGRRRG
jgi:hypothetical protein